MMLRGVIVKTVALVHLIEMRKTDCLERQAFSCTYLAHHELESKLTILIIINTVANVQG